MKYLVINEERLEGMKKCPAPELEGEDSMICRAYNQALSDIQQSAVVVDGKVIYNMMRVGAWSAGRTNREATECAKAIISLFEKGDTKL